MGKTTGISWARSTRNFWSGCTKVGPGCDGCYAEAFNRWTRGKDAETGEAKNWGPGRARVPHLSGADRDLRKWNQLAAYENKKNALWKGRMHFWPVFLNTQSDTFDNEVPDMWRGLMFTTMEECERLTFYLVTKRIGNVAGMVPPEWMKLGFPSNVRLLVTVVNQEEADRDLPKLLALPCKNGVSYEPALGPIDWAPWLPRLQWIIVGGESAQAGHQARPFNVEWAESVIAQCRAAGTACFVKQLGSLLEIPNRKVNGVTVVSEFIDSGKDSKDDPADWHESLRVQEFPA